MKLQLAKIYRGDTFFGYGIAVDGVLVEQQINTNIITSIGELPIINVQFTLTDDQVEEPITIKLGKYGETQDITAKGEGAGH